MKTTLGAIILLDSSFRHTVDPLPNATAEHPPGAVDLEVEIIKGEEPNAYAVKLRGKIESPKSPYAITATYAVILEVDMEGEPAPDNLDTRIMVTGATMAFPYLRELISNLTSRARFGPVWLTPTNFNALLGSKATEATAKQ